MTFRVNVITHPSWKSTAFGDMLVFDMPDDCDVVLLAQSHPAGMRVKKVLLPHQVYRKTIEELGGDVVLIPARARDYIEVRI